MAGVDAMSLACRTARKKPVQWLSITGSRDAVQPDREASTGLNCEQATETLRQFDFHDAIGVR
jgi:hypothetical protein